MASTERPNFELRLIRVNWADRDEVASIESAQHPISLHRNSSDELFNAEVPAYPKIDGLRHGQLAVSADTDTPPQLGDSEDAVTMESVTDTATGETWWIEKGKWKKPSKGLAYHDAFSCRHAGDLILHIGDQRCKVHFTVPEFGEEEFGVLLSDFQDECWQLILSDESYITTPSESESTIPGEAFVEKAREVLKATEQILKRPHRELREVQKQQRISRVRPVARTFMELASKGWPRKVTGRGHKPDYNTPENQYIASIIERLLRAVHFLHRGGQAQRDRISRQISWMNQRMESMKEGVTQVDPVRLENFAAQEEKRIQKWRARSKESFPIGDRSRDNPRDVEVVFRVTSEPTTEYWGTLSFYADVLEGGERATTLNKHLFRFECGFYDTNFFKIRSTYQARLSFRVTENQTRDGRPYALWKIVRIANVDIIQPEQLREAQYLRKKAKHIRSGDTDKQKVALKRQWEQEEQERERQSLEKRTQFYDQIRTQWAERLNALRRVQRDLSEVKRQIKQLGIKSSPHVRYPGTMVFIEQPAYRAAHAAYQDLQGKSGFQADLFDRLLSLDDLSILDLPTVYERWCLLQIVRVLEDEYGFEPIDVQEGRSEPYPSWREDMVDTVCQTREQPFEIYFRSHRLHRYVKLTYQAKLQSGKRPDFLIETHGRSSQEHSGRKWVRKRIVLDAKFKQYKTSQNGSERGTIGHEIDFLVNGKDYAERQIDGHKSGNAVFVLHPSKDAIPRPTTFQEWAASSYYGGERVFEWQENAPNHQQGGILVRPQQRDDIKRLIAMLLSYPGEENQGVYKDTNMVEQQLFCVVCGESKISEIEPQESRDSKGHWYRCSNGQCGHFMVLHYCGTCGHRLWKHGSYWTFHDTHPLSPYNIKCPNCGDYAPVSKENSNES